LKAGGIAMTIAEAQNAENLCASEILNLWPGACRSVTREPSANHRT
jgi:hypothetical protein